MINRNGMGNLILSWCCRTFGRDVALDKQERLRRLLEETGKLCRAGHLSKTEAMAVLTDAYDRDEASDITRKLGGVSVTLLAVCVCLGVDADIAQDREFTRGDQLLSAAHKARAYAAAVDRLEAAHAFINQAPLTSLGVQVTWRAGSACVGYKELTAAVSAIVDGEIPALFMRAIALLEKDVTDSLRELGDALPPDVSNGIP